MKKPENQSQKEPSQAAQSASRIHYRMMGRFPRYLLIIVSLLLLGASVIAAYAALHRTLPHLLVVAQIPYYWYLIAGLVFLGVLLSILLFTRSHRDLFEREVRRMKRMARNRLMQIGDKAWEPEWCITATDYRTMVRTARKLKHPIFCYVDRESVPPAAYFYVYYGENNYCYTFKGPTNEPQAGSLPGSLDDLDAGE
jgi:hypothetical protein